MRNLEGTREREGTQLGSSFFSLPLTEEWKWRVVSHVVQSTGSRRVPGFEFPVLVLLRDKMSLRQI